MFPSHVQFGSHSPATSTVTGLTLTGQAFSLTSGYVIPTTTEESNWNTAYGWGNHAGLYTPIAHKTTEDALNGLVKVDGAGNYSAVTDNSTNWNTAYGWGNHASVGYLISESDTLDIVAGRGATTDVTCIFENNITLGKNGVGGTAGVLTLRDGANPGTTATLSYAKWADLEGVNGLIKGDGLGGYSAALADTDYLTPTTAATTYLKLDLSNDPCTGQLALSTQGNTGGLLVGTDCALYRESANLWLTPDALQVDGGIGVGAAPTSQYLNYFAKSTTSATQVIQVNSELSINQQNADISAVGYFTGAAAAGAGTINGLLGLSGYVYTNTDQSGAMGSLSGLTFSTNHLGTCDINLMTGCRAGIQIGSTADGNITTINVVQADIYDLFDATGINTPTIGTASFFGIIDSSNKTSIFDKHGLYLNFDAVDRSAYITNFYGIRITKLMQGTNNYAISLDGTALNSAQGIWWGTDTVIYKSAAAEITMNGNFIATTFEGNITGNVIGNVTGNCSGSSGSCTGNAATVTNGVYTTDTGTVTAKMLQNAATDLGDADITVNLTNSNAGNVTNLILDGSITAGSFIGSLTGNADTATTSIVYIGSETGISGTGGGATTLTSSNSGKGYYNTAAADINLPNGTAGQHFSFIVNNASYFKIIATNNQTIRYQGDQTAANGYIRSQTVGNTIHMVFTTEWIIDSLEGAWTYDS